MILSNRYNFLYVHIAKTGGTSVRAALKSLQWKDPYYLAQFICSRLSHLTGHRIAAKLPRHAKIIAAQEMLPHEFFDGLFKFAFVRNPWDLQVSSYHHLKRERPHLLPASGVRPAGVQDDALTDAEQDLGPVHELVVDPVDPLGGVAPGAQRASDRNLAFARSHPRQRQVGEVRARDQQHEPDRRQQHPQRALHVADDAVVKWREIYPHSGIRVGILLLQPRGDDIHLGLHLRDANAGFQMSDGAEDAELAVLHLLRRVGHPHQPRVRARPARGGLQGLRHARRRALARAAAAEMHSGFTALRNAAPMNLRASHPGKVDLDAVAGDLKRIERLWGDLLSRSGGPYLFGQFTAADAMFAPVATRIRTYELPTTDLAGEYVEAIYALPAFQEWFTEAAKEPWVVEHDEIDVILAKKGAAGSA